MEARLFVGCDLVDNEVLPFCGGQVSVFTRHAPEREGPNQDAALVLEMGPDQGVLAVADGAGGHVRGADASAAALRALAGALEEAREGTVVLREAVLRGFEAANAAVRALVGEAATTLVVAQIQGRRLRSFHVGDSALLAVGQRGRRKLFTVAHSPSGLAVEAGLLDEEEAVHEDDRHLVLNLLGDLEMRIDMSAALELAPRDSVVLASDGLFDNLYVDEVAERVRTGPLRRAAKRVTDAAARRMGQERPDVPSKPDDLTVLVYRPTPGRPPRSSASPTV